MNRWLAPYAVGVDGPFGFAEAAHLYRRAAFGAPRAHIEELVALGPAQGASHLLAADEGDLARRIDAMAEALNEVNDLRTTQGLWLMRMCVSAAPALEKLSLFWHDHFATSHAKVQSCERMWNQYRLFRAKGLGSFEELLQEVSRDPAMLLWLDSNSNRDAHPNENFARELFELFTLGVGHYTEKDVQEAARAFTGWHERRGKFCKVDSVHDHEIKHLFGQSGAFDGDDVVRRCVAHPACARHLARRLLEHYVDAVPKDEWIDELAEAVRAHGFRMREVLEILWSSRLFYSSAVRTVLIKSPVELCVGTLRVLGARADFKALADLVREMGQSLFAPPSVKGWDGDRAWISSQSLLTRQRFASELAYGGSIAVPVDYAELLRGVDSGAAARAPEYAVGAVVDRLHQSPIEASTRAALEEFARHESGKGKEPLARGLVLLLVASADYQLA